MMGLLFIPLFILGMRMKALQCTGMRNTIIVPVPIAVEKDDVNSENMSDGVNKYGGVNSDGMINMTSTFTESAKDANVIQADVLHVIKEGF